jgi:DNA-binding NtrC family response regulator
MKASVLIVDDDRQLLKLLSDRFRYWGHATDTASDGIEALKKTAGRVFDLIVLDLNMPGMGGLEVIGKLRGQGCDADLVVLTAHGSVERAVEAMRLGAADFLTKPADFDHLQSVVERALEKRRLGRVNAAMAQQIADQGGLVEGRSPAMQGLLATAAKAAASDATILLTGESGTGKQLFAEFIHRSSPRSRQPFVYVNCVAISDDLIESTLFGHEKGAFTGAVGRKAGRLESATGGTAFLDEIGDISGKLQTKLLHFLESGEFERVGGTQTVTVDCRVVAATNRDLQEEVKEGRFREDLYYRLNVIALHVPALRERREDVSVLAQAFLDRFRVELKRDGLAFAPETLEILQAYPWPGNVRQLKNAVERMAVLAEGSALEPEHLPPEIRGGGGRGVEDLLELPWESALKRFKTRLLRAALDRSGGNQTRAAKWLGIQRSYLNRLVKELEGESPS